MEENPQLRWIRGNPKRLRIGQVASEMTSHLTLIFSQSRGEEEREMEGEKGEEGVRERNSTFSLDFPAIGPSNPGEARGKVDPHCKGYAWVLGLWSFDKLREVGVFSYLI